MKIFLLIVFGFLSGILGGMGMGGGTILIPMLTVFAHFNQHTSQGINLVVFIPMAIISIIIHIKNKLIDFKVALPIIAVGLVSSILSAMLANKIQGENLRLYFSIFLIALGLFQLISVIVKIVKDKKVRKK